MRLFNVECTEDIAFVRLRIYFLGLKISFKYFSIKYINFVFDYYKYLKKHLRYKTVKKDTNTIKRLFITSGNLSLINTLACINQLNLTKNSKNSILVWSHAGTEEFQEVNKNLANSIELENYYKFCNVKLSDLYNHFIKNEFKEFDEIYFPNCRYTFDMVNILFPGLKYNITEEGVCVLVKHSGIDYSNVEKYIFAKYLNKLDMSFLNENDKQKLITLKKSEFLKIANKYEKLYPLDVEFEPEDKNIIFCGTLSSLGIWSFAEIIKYQNEIIEKLTSKGYKVYFKPHPRDIYNYKESDKFRILKTKLPLECYNLQDKCLAVVSLFSSTSSQIYHYQGVAGFCDTDLIKGCSDFGLNIVGQYSMSYKTLLDIDIKSKTFAEIKKEILDKYTLALNDKPLLSENDYLNKLYKTINFPTANYSLRKTKCLNCTNGGGGGTVMFSQ